MAQDVCSVAGPLIILGLSAIGVIGAALASLISRSGRAIRIMVISVISAISFAVLVCGLWWIEIHLFAPQKAMGVTTEAHFWIQVLLGKWTPISPYASRSPWFSLSIGVAFMLTLGLYVGIFELWRKVTRLQQEIKMRQIDMLLGRDQSIKNRIKTSVFPIDMPDAQRQELEKKLDAAFEAGHQTWFSRHIVTIFGERRAARERERLYEQIE